MSLKKSKNYRPEEIVQIWYNPIVICPATCLLFLLGAKFKLTGGFLSSRNTNQPQDPLAC